MDFNQFMGMLRREPLKHVYLLAGEEPYYIDRAREAILGRMFPDAETMESGLVSVPGDAAAAELIGAIESVPFFSDRNVVLVEHTGLFQGKKKQEQDDNEEDDEGAEEAPEEKDPALDRLADLLLDMPEDSYVIFSADRAADRRKKLYKAAAKAGAVLEANPVRPWKINDWLQGKLQSIGRDMDREARDYFANAIGMMKNVPLRYLDREFDKLALYAEGRKITRRDLEAAFSDLPEVSLFALADAVSERSARKALTILGRQIRDGAYLPLILAILARHVRQLWQLKLLVQQGRSSAEIARRFKLNPYIAERLIKAARGFSEETLRDAFLELSDADFGLKTGRSGPERLEHAIIRLCRG